MNDPEHLHTRIQSIEEQLRADETRMADFERKLDDNTDITREIRDIMLAVKGGFRVIGGLGVAAVWVGKIAAAGMAVYGVVYALAHGGRPPGGQ